MSCNSGNCSGTRSEYDFCMTAGTSKDFEWLWTQTDGTTTTPIDITGYTAVMEIRRSQRDISPLLSVVGQVTGAEGRMLFELQPSDTDASPSGLASVRRNMRYVYRVTVTATNGDIINFSEGQLKVNV